MCGCLLFPPYMFENCFPVGCGLLCVRSLPSEGWIFPSNSGLVDFPINYLGVLNMNGTIRQMRDWLNAYQYRSPRILVSVLTPHYGGGFTQGWWSLITVYFVFSRAISTHLMELISYDGLLHIRMFLIYLWTLVGNQNRLNAVIKSKGALTKVFV